MLKDGIASMRAHTRSLCVLLTATGLALAGCESTGPSKGYVDGNELANSKQEALALAEGLPSAEEVPAAKPEPAKSQPKTEPRPAAGAPAPKVAASEAPSESPFEGTVVLLNLQKGFVIVDFARSKMPPARSELGVYRGGIFVGSLRITPPAKGSLVAADILSGTLRRGDTVR